jgi:uncharacterized protein
MTPEERELINGLFERMRSFGAPEKDRDAEALISQGVRATPDAAYMLVQSVLVQEQALQEAGSRIQALEEQVRDLQGGRERTSGSGSFLGGLLGTGRAASEPRSGSVPQIGARATPSAYDDRRPWSPPQNAPPQQPASPPQAAGGGFLRSAMATAAGVAGGMLAAGAIRDMLGGGSAHANTPASNPASGTTETATAEQARLDAEDDARQDALDDNASWDSGDSGGGDLDI